MMTLMRQWLKKEVERSEAEREVVESGGVSMVEEEEEPVVMVMLMPVVELEGGKGERTRSGNSTLRFSN